MNTRSRRPSGSFARASRSASATRNAVARTRKPALKQATRNNDEADRRSVNRNDIVADPARSVSKPSPTVCVCRKPSPMPALQRDAIANN